MGQCMAKCKRNYKEKKIKDKKNVTATGIITEHEENVIEDVWNMTASGSADSDKK